MNISKKNDKSLYLIIVVLFILLVCCIGYLLYDKLDNDNANKGPENKIMESAKKIYETAKNNHVHGETVIEMIYCSKSLYKGCDELELEENELDYVVTFSNNKIVRIYVGSDELAINVRNKDGINIDDLGKKYKVEPVGKKPELSFMTISTIDENGNRAGGPFVVEVFDD